MREVERSDDGIFIPKELIPDFENARVEISGATVVIKSRSKSTAIDEALAEIDEQREDILRQHGLLSDSGELIREFRDSR